ncbi:MAG: ATP-binding protein, partial [Pseudomonadota bacterium]
SRSATPGDISAFIVRLASSSSDSACQSLRPASFAQRLEQHRADLRRNPSKHRIEAWTLYPNGNPVHMDCAFHWCPLPDQRDGMLVEAMLHDKHDPVMLRSIDALMHSQVMTGLYGNNGKQLFANRALRDVMGSGGNRFGDNFIDREMRYAFMSGLAQSGEHRATVEIRTSKGKRWLDMQAIRCTDAASGERAFQISATDITVTYTQERNLRAARDAALSADRAKSEFVATMSHEMRTPMNGILGMVELLSFTRLDDRQAAQLEIIRDSGKALLALIEDVLDLSSLEIRAITPVREPFDLHELAKGVVSGLLLPAEDKGLSLRLEIDRNVPQEGIGDARRLAQLMRNLIANAIKFTMKGSVDLHIGREGMSTLRVDVIDTGPGVPEDKRDMIFEKFHQLDQSRSKHDGGVGLGLAICKELVSLFNGKIGVQNVSSGGSRFWFTIPDVLANSHYIHRRAAGGEG